MSRQRVAFPSFRIEEAIKPYDMRQLVAALEYRFQSLEEQESTIPDTTFSDDLDALYAPIIHTHVVADILDFDENVPSSIFDLDDVNGVPTVGQSLIWDGDEFLPGTAGGSLALSELTDVYVPTPTDTQVLTWVDVNNRWEALDVGSIGGGVDNLFELDDTDLTTQTTFDMLYNEDGENWHDTASLLKWNPYEGYLQLATDTSINWLDDGFNSTELLAFSGALAGTPISYATVSVKTSTQLSTSGFATIAGMTIDQTTLVSGDDYLVIAHLNTDTDNSNGLYMFVKIIDAQGATVNGTLAENEVESGQGNQDDTSGVFQQLTSVFTCDHTGTGLLELQAHETGPTSTYQEANFMSMFVMNLTQFGADAQWDYVTGYASTYIAPIWGGLGNTLTIGDDASDYLLIGSMATTSPSGGSGYISAFRIDGVVTETLSSIFRSNNAERKVQSSMWVLEAPAAGTVVEYVGSSQGNFGRFTMFHITAIRLDAFTQYESSIVADPPEATADVIYDLDTLSFTSGAASGPWGFFSSRSVANSAIRGESLISINGGARVLTAFDLGYQQDQSGWGTSVEFPDVFPTIEPGDTVDMYLSHNPTSSFATDGIRQSVAIAVPMTLGGTAIPIFEVGDPSFDTKIDGLTTNIRSVATDIDGTLNVDGAATFVTTLNAQGAVDFDVTLNVDGAVTFVDTLNVQGAVDFDTTLNVDGATTLVGTLNGQGAVDFDTTLNVDGVASFQADLDLSAVSAINIDSNEIAVLIPAVDASAGGSGGDANWSSVSLLANFDGADADVIYTSEDDALQIATFVGTAALDTAQFQFGTSSLLVDGNSDYITFPNSTDFDFGAGDFTIECWVRFNGDPGTANMAFIVKWNTSPLRSWFLGLVNNQLDFSYSITGSDVVTIDEAWNPVGSQWYHLAVVRSGNFIELFVDGASLGAATAMSDTIATVSTVVSVGSNENSGVYANFMNGWIDDVRITKGVGRHAVEFTPPTEPHTDFDNYWNSVVVQHDFAGVDAATTAVDVADHTIVPTFFGTAAIDTAQSKFGGSALLLDGNSDYVTIPHSTDIGLLNGADLTVECWLRPSSLTINMGVLNKSGVSGSIWPNYSLGVVATTGIPNFTVYFNGGVGAQAIATTGLVVDTWTHVVGVWDDANDTASIYVNGVREASTQNTFTIFDNGGALYTGVQSGGVDFFDGHIDDLRITKTDLYGKFAVPNREYVAADNADAVIVNFNGADAATTYTTDDSTALTVTFFGSTALDNAQRRFGSTSLTVPAAADYVSIPSDAATQFGSGDFGVEMWIRPSGITGTDIIYDQRSTGTQQALTIYLSAGVPYIFVNGANRINGPTALTTNTWYHLCVQRESGVTRMFLDGAQIGIDYTDTNVYVSNPIFFGRDWTNTANGFDGWLDSLRILVGAPLYPVNFLPPTLETPAEDSSWSNVSFLASLEGVDGDVVYTSDDSAGRVATFFGTAALDDAQAKFGSTSLLLDGNSDYITFPTSTDFDFAADDFTVECWVMLNDANNIEYYVSHYDSAISLARHWAFGYDGVADTMQFLTSTDGIAVTTISSSTYVATTGVWIHFAACRVGGNLRMYADGVEYYNTANTTNIHYTTGTQLDIGALHGGSGLTHWTDGWIDEVRITKGIGRYAAAFTPPPRAFLRDTPAATDPVAAELAIYTVGDALIDTQIDGVETTVTGELTFLDKLNASVTTVITTSYTAGAEHVILVDDDTAGGTVTIALPAVADGDTLYHIKKLGSTALVVVDGDEAETIEGALTATLTTQYESIMLVSDGVSWHVI